MARKLEDSFTYRAGFRDGFREGYMEAQRDQAEFNRTLMGITPDLDKLFLDATVPMARKKAQKKRRKDPKMKKALTEANAKYRTKSGKLRKGRTQKDIMELAHKLRRRM